MTSLRRYVGRRDELLRGGALLGVEWVGNMASARITLSSHQRHIMFEKVIDLCRSRCHKIRTDSGAKPLIKTASVTVSAVGARDAAV